MCDTIDGFSNVNPVLRDVSQLHRNATVQGCVCKYQLFIAFDLHRFSSLLF